MKHAFNLIKQNKIIVIIAIVILVAIVTVLQPQNVLNTKGYSIEQGIMNSAPVMMARSSGGYAEADMAIEMDKLMPYPDSPREEAQAPYDGSVERRLIKTGSLSMVVRDINETRVKVVQIVQNHDGFIANQHFNQNERYSDNAVQSILSGSITVKIPQESFDSAMNQLRPLALVMTSESTNVNDVTEQYYDLDTRLKNKKAEEQRYRDLLAQATDVSDMLEITQYIERARGEAERLQGQLNVMQNQSNLSTINLYLEAERPYSIGGVSWDPWGHINDAWKGLLGGLTNLADRTITTIVYIPLIVLYVALYGGILYVLFRIGIKTYRKIKK